MVYLAMGVFVNKLVDDEFSPFLAVFWPIFVFLILLMVVVLIIPYKIAELIKKKMKK